MLLWNRIVGLAATAVFCLMVVACATKGAPSGLVISDVTVVSAERAEPLEHAYVRIIDGRIAEVTKRPLHGEHEVDGAGYYLIPGLIDTHVHLAITPGWPAPMSPEQAAANPDIVAAAIAQDPRSFLFHGFTTVLDLIGTGERTARWNALDIRPDAYFCGMTAVLNGEFRVVLTPGFSYGRGPDIDPDIYTAATAVDHITTDGAICVKTTDPMTLEQAQTLVSVAHAHDLPVFIHANRKDSQGLAVAAGMDVIAHGMWRNMDESAALDDDARDILASVIRNYIGYQPTTQVIVALIDELDEGYLLRPELADVYPRTLVDWYGNEISGRAAEAFSAIGVDSVIEFRRATVGRATEITRIMADNAAHLLFGSDTPSATTYSNPPGLNGRLEMNNWIAGGVTEEKLFRALTIDNATIMKLEDEIGTVEVGKTANLLLLGANPLESVEAYDAIKTVFLHGQPIARETLSARNAKMK